MIYKYYIQIEDDTLLRISLEDGHWQWYDYDGWYPDPSSYKRGSESESIIPIDAATLKKELFLRSI